MSNSIFPSGYASRTTTTTNVNTASSTPSLLKEYAVDFDTNTIIVDPTTGAFTIVTGLEAVAVRCWLALKIQRNRFIIYPTGIGNTLKSLLGKNIAYANKNIPTILDEALVDGTYVTSITDISLAHSDSTNIMSFTVNSIYGSTTLTATY